jgi:hypothetical protein
MLSRLLELLREGGTRQMRNLVVELDTTPELIESMLEDLARMGYVRRISTVCSEECMACPLSGTCAAGGPSDQGSNGQGLTAWVLAEETRGK